MQFIDTPEPGGPEVMVVSEAPRPDCGPEEVLIRVQAAGVNRPDILQRQGLYPAPEGASAVLGLEAAGEIVATGERVSKWRVGDRVCALCNGGAYAEYVVVPQGQCLPVPKGLTAIEAASIPETFFTVWSNVFQRAGLTAGESLLVHGGSSGIGVTAIQLASALGAKVFVTAGSEEKCNACVELGANHAINYRQQDFVDAIKSLTDKRGVDVILDMVGGDYIQKNLRCAAVDGRIVNIAFLTGSVAEVNFMPIMLKRLTLSGSTLRSRTAAVKADIAETLKREVWPLLESGRVKPVIFKTFKLSEVAQAHQLMESNQHIGKIVLSVSE